MDYESWERRASPRFGGDPIWGLKVYRKALYLAECTRADLAHVPARFEYRKLREQLRRSVGSIRVNLTEGYGRMSPSERLTFYEYSLASARESRDWYVDIREFLPERTSLRRFQQTSEVIAMLTGLVRTQRRKARESRDDPMP